MPVDSEWVYLDNDPFGTASYEFVIERVDSDGKNARVELYNERTGTAAFMEDCDYELYINGRKVDSDTGSPTGRGSTFTLSGPASPGDTWEYVFYSPYWHDTARREDWDGYIRFSGEVPEIEASSGDVSTSPSPPIMEDLYREGFSIEYSVSNNSMFDTIYPTVSAVGPNGTIMNRRVEAKVPSGESGKVSINVKDIHDQLSYEWSTGDYEFCMLGSCATFTLDEGQTALDVDRIYTDPDQPKQNIEWDLVFGIANRTSRDILDVNMDVQIAGASTVENGTIKVSVSKDRSKKFKMSRTDVSELLGITQVPSGDYTVCLGK